MMRKIALRDELPEYSMTIVKAADGSPAAHFIRRDVGERTAISDAIIEFDQLYADTIAKKQGDLLL